MPQLKKRNKMYLLTKNLKTKKVSKKLNHVKIGLFFIKQQKKSVNYELDLSSNIKIHSIFHVSLLKSADSRTFIQNMFHFQYEDENEYEIEKILAQNDQKYFIKWKNYFISENTWKPIDNLKNAQLTLREFHRTIVRNRKRNRSQIETTTFR